MRSLKISYFRRMHGSMKKGRAYWQTYANGAAYMADNILLNKAAIIERCLKRIDEDYRNDKIGIRKDFTRQDAIILNLQRACEAAIDSAMHLVRINQLGLPQESREAFQLLENTKIIQEDLSKKMQAMVGFRNIVVHNYQKLNLEILESILDERLVDFNDFVKTILNIQK